MSIDLVHDDVEKDLIKVTSKNPLEYICFSCVITTGQKTLDVCLFTCAAIRKWKSSSHVKNG